MSYRISLRDLPPPPDAANENAGIQVDEHLVVLSAHDAVGRERWRHRWLLAEQAEDRGARGVVDANELPPHAGIQDPLEWPLESLDVFPLSCGELQGASWLAWLPRHPDALVALLCNRCLPFPAGETRTALGPCVIAERLAASKPCERWTGVAALGCGDATEQALVSPLPDTLAALHALEASLQDQIDARLDAALELCRQADARHEGCAQLAREIELRLPMPEWLVHGYDLFAPVDGWLLDPGDFVPAPGAERLARLGLADLPDDALEAYEEIASSLHAAYHPRLLERVRDFDDILWLALRWGVQVGHLDELGAMQLWGAYPKWHRALRELVKSLRVEASVVMPSLAQTGSDLSALHWALEESERRRQHPALGPVLYDAASHDLVNRYLDPTMLAYAWD